MVINCVIVEDEPLAMERTREYVSRLPFLNLLAVFSNGIDALTFLRNNKVDLMFLDINMDGFSGIQLLESAKIFSKVIITTAYDEYALKGFELNVTDYLLKPFTFDRFLQAVNKVQHHMPAPDRKFIFVKTEYRLEKLMLGEIVYIQGMRDYRKIFTTTNPVMTLQTFTELEREIPADILCRVHKSYMVSVARIESVEKDCIKVHNAIIPISDTYRKTFYRIINHAL